METAKNTVNYVTETIQGTGAAASKEVNKEVAKDNNADLSTRATAAKDALFDKKDEKVHDTRADVYKEAAQH
ncbi:glucose-repressible protein Grg1 [Aspergillus crustosus]